MTDDRALLPFDEGNGRLIRRQWHDGRWFFSVVDVVSVLTDSPNPRNYWSMLKRRLADEGAAETYTNCVQLKMRSLDGKLRATDAADTETMLRIVQSIPSPKAEPIKLWLAKVGTEKLEEIAESEDLLSGMTTEQRAIFLRGQIADRNTTLAAAAHDVGVVSGRDFAVFQDWGYRGLYAGETARDIATRKGLKRGEKILDWMVPDELAANLFRASLAEQRLRQGDATNKAEANQVHHETGAAVRRVIIEQGATVPEQMPTPEVSIQDLERREQKRLDAERQPSLFTDLDGETGES
jgi:DNA-damage-inducible protein D